MKKFSAVLIVLMLLFAACGEDPSNGSLDTSGSNMDIVPAEIQKLMVDGDQMLDDVVASYTNITDQTMKDYVRGLADYTLFPVDFESGAPFSDRMKAYLGGENNLRNALLIQEDIANGRTPGSSIPDKMARRVSARHSSQYYATYLETAGPLLNLAIPGAGTVCKIVGGLLGKKKPSIESKIYKQLTVLSKTMDQYQKENRQNFGLLLSKSDEILGNLATLAGDVNRVKSEVLAQGFMGDMQDIKDGFNGVIGNLQTLETTTDMSNASYFYCVTSSQFMTHIEQFFTAASNIHKWAVENTNDSGYTVYIGDDATIAGDKKLIKVVFYTNVSNTGGLIDPYEVIVGFPNPKNTLMMSIGDLDFLSSMMLTRITMNGILYTDETVKSNYNATLAQYFINKLKPVKASVNQAFKKIVDIKNSFLTSYEVFFTETRAIFNAANPGADRKGYDLYSSVGDLQYQWQVNKSYFNACGEIFGNGKCNSEFELAYRNKYLMVFAARLMALETQLQGYLQ